LSGLSCKSRPSDHVDSLRVLGIWFTNAWNTAYLPINSPGTWDNTAGRFNVTKIIDNQGNLDLAAYQEYSEPYMTAGTIVAYIFYFIMYSASK
jgi:hypothetical protein